jgi:hypothetical protein
MKPPALDPGKDIAFAARERDVCRHLPPARECLVDPL